MTPRLSPWAGPAPNQVGTLGEELFLSPPQFPPGPAGILLPMRVDGNNYTRKMFAKHLPQCLAEV